MTTMTTEEREAARKEILDTMDYLRTQVGNKPAAAETVAVIAKRLFREVFALADELRFRLEVLESTSMTYEGTYSRDKAYKSGSVVTHRGTIWHCESPDVTSAEPGRGGAWKMMAKSAVSRGAGRFAK